MSVRAFQSLTTLLVIGAVALPAQADVALGINDVRSLFHLSKSENRNEVHFGVRLDARCQLVPDEAMVAYWREREVSETATSRLTMFERPAYGIDEVARFSPQHARVALRALPARTIDVQVTRGENGSCEGAAITQIRGEPAVLSEVYVKLSGWSVDYVIVRAERLRDGAVVEERIRP